VIDGGLATIASGLLRPEQPLGPERQLARRFGVARRHVRAARRALIDAGIVVIGPDGEAIVASSGTDPSLAALVRTRRLVSA
jgi:DNA-binding FadR family transcriptional regulator